jgi:hypothetical protein
LDGADPASMLAERMARDEMRTLDLTVDFKKFVFICRKVAFY